MFLLLPKGLTGVFAVAERLNWCFRGCPKAGLTGVFVVAQSELVVVVVELLFDHCLTSIPTLVVLRVWSAKVKTTRHFPSIALGFATPPSKLQQVT